MAWRRMVAYVDEAGQRATTQASSDHFVMSAIAVPEDRLDELGQFAEVLRDDLGRQPGDVLHWRNLRTHGQRVHAAVSIGQAAFIRHISVVVCKPHLAVRLPTEDHAYLFTFRLLLERLSYLAADKGMQLDYTLSHIVRFKKEQLRAYEAKLRQVAPHDIAWRHVDPRGGRIDQPRNHDGLQLADFVASGTFAAFEPDQYGNTEQRYIREMAPRLMGRDPVTSYGVKMHPWNERTQALYAWVSDLR